MKLLAKNQITVTKSLFLEGMLRISRDGYGKSARKAVFFLLALWVILLAFTIATKGSITQTTSILIPVVFVSLWILVIMPRSHAKKAWKAQEVKFGSQMERTTYFYDDHLEIQGDCVARTIAYGDIRQILHSRRMLILITEDKVGIMLARNGFETLTVAEIEALIQNKEMEI